MPARVPAPPGVDHPDLRSADERDGNAVGHGDREAEVGLRGDQRVGLAGEARPGDAHHRVPRDLPHPGRGLPSIALRMMERFSSTASGSSPTFLETFRES